MTRNVLPARGAAPSLRTFGLIALAGCAASLLAAPSAHAQLSGMMGRALQAGPSGGVSSGKNPDARFITRAPPPGVPGARGNPDTVAPLQRPPSEMKPTEALFDAVNRGDIAAARTAIGRGADLNAHNILGLTPIDLSVDIGRTDITFLLLSMRRADTRASETAANARTDRPPAPHAAARIAPSNRSVAAARPMPVRQAPVMRPTVTADAGTPRPSVGFLGFGGPGR